MFEYDHKNSHPQEILHFLPNVDQNNGKRVRLHVLSTFILFQGFKVILNREHENHYHSTICEQA